jgi:hypothetical protein
MNNKYDPEPRNEHELKDEGEQSLTPARHSSYGDSQPESHTEEELLFSNRPYLTVKAEHFASLIGEEMKIMSREGKDVFVHGSDEWVPVTTREDGTPALELNSARLANDASEPFLMHVIDILLNEAEIGLLTQESLDVAVDQCRSMIPDKDGWIGARALHEFLLEHEEYEQWACGVIFPQMQNPNTDCRMKHESSIILRPERLTKDEAEQEFQVNAQFALEIARNSKTRRGEAIRHQIRKLVLLDQLAASPMINDIGRIF